jgi:hypothetical protein
MTAPPAAQAYELSRATAAAARFRAAAELSAQLLITITNQGRRWPEPLAAKYSNTLRSRGMLRALQLAVQILVLCGKGAAQLRDHLHGHQATLQHNQHEQEQDLAACWALLRQPQLQNAAACLFEDS